MVIDPKLYEKVTGRSGNPAERLAIANATLADRKRQLGNQREAARERRKAFWRFGVDGVILHAVFSRSGIVGVVIVAIVIAGTIIARLSQ